MASADSPYYHAIIDMGSNGIRFSITNLSPATARSMPTVYLDRAGISLYDAQYDATSGAAQPIPDAVVERVVASLVRFKRTCADFGVPAQQVRFLATEATRTAANSQRFRDEIKRATGWEVEMLAKEEEGRIGAMGVASSYPVVKGLVMDLGGGSTQLTWLVSRGDGDVQMPPSGSVSMPYGAAALSRRLATEDNARLKQEVTGALKAAVAQLALPEELRLQMQHEGGLPLYLSGGGFRGWGFVLMSQHPIQPYPIPIINGFRSTRSAFHDEGAVRAAVAAASAAEAALAPPSRTPSSDGAIFRVSGRRASQVPAVAFLISCLADALPAITTVHFCQGGVREGAIFARLDASLRKQHPLVAASSPGAPRSAATLLRLLLAALPPQPPGSRPLPILTHELLHVVANALHAHAAVYKDLRAAAALRHTTTGGLAAVHGVGHAERAALALALCERWGGRGALAPADAGFYDALAALAAREGEGLLPWWCLLVGRVGALLGELYPAGLVAEGEEVVLGARWEGERVVIEVDIPAGEGGEVGGSVAKALKKLDRCGKKKNWHGGRGFKVSVRARYGGKAVDFDAAAEEAED